ncbi:MAG TPA: winged helix-turn-helix domain-containing protein [Piscinibacter sp.]|nr:winged helix-turn-helix domain-containing protein [Piscinibacter sp.]
MGAWRIDAVTGELRRSGETVRLEPKVAEVLVHLARRAGEVVSRDELLTAVWPGVVVGDDALTQVIIKLRKALGDDAKRPAYIETLSKRGYRLIAPVARAADAAAAVSAAATAGTLAAATAAPPPPAEVAERTERPAASALLRSKPRPWRLALLGGGLTALLVATGWGYGIYRGWAWPIGSENTPRAAAEALPVIAVLPLVNASGDPAREFFSDGVSDEIIHALGRYSGLRVISRSSVQQFKQREASTSVVSKELGARYVVTGAVREADGQVRVAVELSDAETARVLWSERFEGQGGEVFKIQDSIVQNIVGALAVKVSMLESDRAATRAPSRREAYDLVLLARAQLLKADRAANRQGRALIVQARELAPDYAMAYVVESELEDQRANLGWVEDPAQGLLLSERATRHALSLNDPGVNARAHAQLGRIHVIRGEFSQALAESERARALNPSDPFIAEVRADTLLWAGRTQEAVELMESAIRLDPAARRSPVRQAIAIAYFASERYPEALAASERALADYPETVAMHTMRAAVLAQMGRLEEARQSVAEVRRLQPNFPVAQFGNRFADPVISERFQAALSKAGF